MSVKGYATVILTSPSSLQSVKDHVDLFCITIQRRLVYSQRLVFFFLEHLLSESVKHDDAE